ncbi:hypothetical protein ABIE89_003195 [Bradyrhizobium niftali]
MAERLSRFLLLRALECHASKASWPGVAVRRTASLPFAYVPAIHALDRGTKNVDARDKPGHDDRSGIFNY